MSDDIVWCEVRLAEVAPIVRGYTLWKDAPWYHRVDWQTVSDAFGQILQSNAVGGVCKDLVSEIGRIEDSLTAIDREGLYALWAEPITVTQVQLTNGGHRLTAMLEQGVESVPGMFHPDDIGESVEPERVYPLAFEAEEIQ